MHTTGWPILPRNPLFRLQPPRQTLFFRVDQNGRGASFSFKLLTTVPTRSKQRLSTPVSRVRRDR
ncbi:MAG: hypothetical protein CMJ83_13780 [Planctomycetes bacterium]|nr:hypothetical protein [Planctomycetota bacterium]